MTTSKPTEREIEDRYASEDREISQERSDFLLPQIMDFIRGKQWMNVQPEYQRRQVWDRKKQSLFIESVLMNLPVPPVFLFEPEYSRYEVMDGQQRLSSIVAFYENRLKLTGLEHWPELNGRYYSDLPLKIQRGLDRRRISAVVLQANSSSNSKDDLRRIVFERLNTGGQKLNAQELRNCVYASPFASKIIELAGYRVFNDLWEIPRYEDNITEKKISESLGNNSLFKRMIDCELVLRYFALRSKKNIKGSVKSILDKCMEANMNTNDNELSQMDHEFKTRIDLAYELFGQSAFKIKDRTTIQEKLSQPFYDAVLVACDRQYKNRDQLVARKTKLSTKLLNELADADVYELVVGRANTADAIKKRLDLVEGWFTSVL